MEFPVHQHDGNDIFVGVDKPQKGEPKDVPVDMYVSPEGSRLIRRYGSEPRNYAACNALLAAKHSRFAGKDRSSLGLAKYLRNLVAVEKQRAA